VTVPIYGKLSDQFGRKPILLLGLGLFLVGSTLCGAATTVGALIAFRAVQGLGAGAVQTTATTIIGDLFSLEERGRVQGAFSAVWGLAGVAGPLLGALIVSNTSWRWIFFINIPFVLATTGILLVSYRETVERKAHVLDWLGAVTLTLGVVALLAATSSEHMLVYGSAAVALLVAFVFVEKRAPEALLPIDLFTQKLMAIASILSTLIGGLLYASTTYLPLYIQGATHGSAAEAGTMLTPMLVCWPIAAALSGRWAPRYGYWRIIMSGAASVTGGTLLLALAVQLGLPGWSFYVASGLLGGGLGLVSLPVILAVQTAVPWEQRGVATASTMFFRIIGGTLAIGFLGAYVSHGLSSGTGMSREAIDALLGPEHGNALAPEVLAPLIAKLKDALTPVFWVMAGMGAAFSVVGCLFPRERAPVAAPPGLEATAALH
jgi:MFS family permease